MSAKPTPGPWKWDDTVWDYDPEEQAPWLVDESDKRILHGTIKCDSEANARLIAAAPDLLQALSELLAMCQRQEDFNDDGDGSMYARAQAAIDKATHR